MYDITNPYTKAYFLRTDCSIPKGIIIFIRKENLLSNITYCVYIRKVVCRCVNGILRRPQTTAAYIERFHSISHNDSPYLLLLCIEAPASKQIPRIHGGLIVVCRLRSLSHAAKQIQVKFQ